MTLTTQASKDTALVQIWGAVCLGDQEFFEEEMLDINPGRRLLYGIDWVYAGDAFFEECSIEVMKKRNGQWDRASFGGRTGLPEALAWIHADNKG